MTPRKKRRRKFISDGGLGISLRDKDEQSPQEEANKKSVSETEQQEPLRDPVDCVEERIMEPNDKDASAEKECISQENITGSLEIKHKPKQCSIPEEQQVAPGNASIIPFTRTEVNSPEYSLCGSPERMCSPEIPYNVPFGAMVSLGNETTVPATTEETVNSPENRVPHIHLNNARNDVSSDETVINILRAVELAVQPSTSANGKTPSPECEEGINCDQASIGSKETEIFRTRYNFQVDDLPASQESRKAAKESDPKEQENVVETKSTNSVQVDHTPAMERNICPPDFGMHRETVLCKNKTLPKVNAPKPTKELQGSVSLLSQRPSCQIIRLDSGSSDSQVSAEHHSIYEHIEKANTQTFPSLSIWSEAQSEYFPRGKQSDLGELLDIATRYVVRAWVKNIRPSISGSPVNLVVKFCPKCHRKFHHDEDVNGHLCSRTRSDSNNSLKLIYYVELEICDETNEMLRVALTGSQAVKLFGCKPEEFIKSSQTQKKVWNAFRLLMKGGNTQNLCLKDAADFSLEPHLKEREMNYRVVDIRPFGPKFK